MSAISYAPFHKFPSIFRQDGIGHGKEGLTSGVRYHDAFGSTLYSPFDHGGNRVNEFFPEANISGNQPVGSAQQGGI